MATVAITGVGGLIGRRLARELDQNEGVGRIVGLDVRAPGGLPARSLEFRQADVRDPDLAGHLADVDVLVHLAFQMDPIADEATMRAVNVDGTRNVFRAAADAGVRKVIYPSSVVAYGAHPDNDFPLTEESSIRANPDFSYSLHKGDVERWLRTWVDEHPEVMVTILRLGLVAGPGIDNAWTRLLLEQPRFTLIKGHRPPLQLAHVDDVLSAFAHAIDHDLPGAYNVACEGWLSTDEVVAISDQRTVEIGEEVAYSALDRLWRMGAAQAPAGFVRYAMYPWVMSPDKLIRTGWRPKHTNRDALADLVEDHRGHIVLGPARLERSKVRLGLAALTAAVGVLGVRSLLRRRRD
ncbi:MAG TPA: NAD-dependent epimerase/dehydratase family protein [Nitriliruptorales bacterium]